MTERVYKFLLKYECPSCGNLIKVKQGKLFVNNLFTGIKLKQPKKCVCGRKGTFKFLDLDLEKDEI